MGIEENARREMRGVGVLIEYREACDQGEDWETVASDLFADLFHAAKGRFNFEAAITRARGHFYEELREANEEVQDAAGQQVLLSERQVAVVRDALSTAIDELDYTTGLKSDYEPEDIKAMHERIADMNALWDVLSGIKRDEAGQVLLSDEDAARIAESS